MSLKIPLKPKFECIFEIWQIATAGSYCLLILPMLSCVFGY